MQRMDKEVAALGAKAVWLKSYRVMGGGRDCFARTRKVLCRGVNEAGRMSPK